MHHVDPSPPFELCTSVEVDVHNTGLLLIPSKKSRLLTYKYLYEWDVCLGSLILSPDLGNLQEKNEMIGNDLRYQNEAQVEDKKVGGLPKHKLFHHEFSMGPCYPDTHIHLT